MCSCHSVSSYHPIISFFLLISVLQLYLRNYSNELVKNFEGKSTSFSPTAYLWAKLVLRENKIYILEPNSLNRSIHPISAQLNTLHLQWFLESCHGPFHSPMFTYNTFFHWLIPVSIMLKDLYRLHTCQSHTNSWG